MRKIYLPAKEFKTLFIFFSFLLSAFWADAQKTWSGAAGASWNVAGNWSPAGIPANTDAVTINAGGTPIVTANAVCASIQINNSTANATTSLTINASQTLTVGATGTGAVTIGNATAMANKASSTTSLIVSGTLLSGNINQSPGNLTSGNGGDGKTDLTINTGGTVTVLGNVTGTSLNGTGILTASASVIFTGTGTLNVTGTFTTSVFTPSTGIVNYNGTLAQTAGYSTYGTLKINNAAGVSMGVANTVGNLTIGDVTLNSILNDNGKQITSSGTFTLTSGTFNIGTGATATAYPNFGTNNIATGTTVNYNSTSAQIISSGVSGINYANLTSVNGSRTLGTSGIIGISGTFTPGNGAYTVGTSTVSFNGIAAQVIPSVTFSFYNLIINNAAGISSIGGNTTITNSLAITNGVVTTGANKIIIPSGGAVTRTNGWINGNLQQYIPSGASPTFHVGNATVYRPVTINFTAGSTAGDLTVVQLGGFHPQIASSGLDNTTPKTITPYWNLTASNGLAGTYDATFTFVAGDVPGAATTSNFIIRRYNASWATTISGIKTATSTQATALTNFGDFCIGEIFAAPTVSIQPVNTAVCLGNNTSFTSASTTTPTTTVQWQRSTDGTTWVNIIATTDGSKYTNFTTNTLTITGPDFTMSGYQYRSVYTNINGSVNSTAVTLTVTKIPTITTLNYAGSPFADITATPQPVTLAGTNAYTGGTYTSDAGLTINLATGAVTPASPSTLGNHTVTYTIAAAGGCGLVSATTVINITSAPTANIDYGASSFCISNISTYTPILTGTGNFNNGGAGFYSVSPASGLLVNSITGAIVPNNASAGTYTITYHIPATTSPTFPASTSNKVIIITPIPTATITYTGGPFCTSDQTAKTVTLNGTGAFSNGVFSASPSGLVLNATTGAFTPNGSTVNNYTITYTIPASGGCAAVPVTATAFNIVAAPTASITYNSGKPYCKAITTPQAVTLAGASGGSFSFTPAGLTIDAAGAITPSSSIAGDYVVTYTIPASGPCGIVQITTPVTISETPTGNISYPLQPYCTSDPAKLVSFITPTGLYAGGVFSSTPGGLTINASTGTITPASSTPNSYTVNYNTPNGCPVIFTTPVQVDGSPTATISYAGTPFCIADGSSKPVTLGGTGSFTGGNYSSTLGLSIDGVNGNITPSTSTAATYLVTYTITPASPNCAAITTTTSVTITPAVGVPTAITISGGAEPTCQLTNGSTTTTYASTATNSTGFNWSLSNGLAGSINPTTGVMTWANGFFGSVDIRVTANGCNGLSAQVIRTVTVNANNSVSAASTTPTLCINSALTDITHTTTGATGIGAATNLPAGVTAAWAANIITISGTPTASGTFNYIIPLTGGCSAVSATGTITVSPNNTVNAASSIPILCINTALTNITHTTTGATSIGTATGLPAGVTAAWAANTITISGTPTASGTFNYTIPLTGGCSTINATGTITVNPNNTVSAASSTPTLCINTALPNITHTTSGATGIGTATNLPAGVTASWSGNTITISGTSTAAGSFNYTIPLTGGCGAVNAVGTINVTAATIAGTLSPSIASPLTICAGANSGTITLSGNNGTVTQWETSINGGALWAIIGNSGNSTLNYTNLALTTLYRVLVTNGTCAGVYSSVGQLVVLPAFTPVITPSATATCIGVPITLTASGYGTSGLVIAEGDFTNTSPVGWYGMNGNASNNSGNGSQIWGVTNNPDTYYGITYGSSTGRYMVTSGATSSNLTTPAFSTVGMSSAVLVFNEGYTFATGAIASIEITTNAVGVGPWAAGPWITLKNYAVPGTSTGLKNPFPVAAGIDLNAYLGLSNLAIRFNYQGAASSVWVLDNVVVTNTISNPTGTNAYNPLHYTWSPTTYISIPSNDTTRTVTLTPTAAVPGSISYTVSASVGSCTAKSTSPAVLITFNPNPVISAMTTVTCSATAFSVTPVNGTNGTVPGGTTYSWGLPGVTGGLTGGATGTGASSIIGTLTNPTNSAQTATYTVTPLSGTCTGATFTVTVTVNPKPAITAMTSAVCSGTGFTVTPVNSTNGVVPTGTTYSWLAPTVTGGITGGVSGSAAANISGTLTNPSTAVQTATYTVTPLSGSCAGSTFTVTVTVNPNATVTNLTSIICSGGTFTVTPVNVTNGIVPTGTTYSWSAPTVTGGITGGASGSGAATISGTLTNPTTTAQTATYTVTPLSGSCTGSTFTVTVTVNPLPTITTTGIAAVCFNTGLQTTTMPYTATTNSPTSYSIVWSGIANQGSTAFAFVAGGGTLTGIVIPAGTTAGTYSGTLTVANGNSCVSSAGIPITVTVNDPVAITAQPATSGFCLGSNSSITVTASGTAPTYQWQVSTTGSGGPWSNLTNVAPYSGVTTATLTLTNPAIGLTSNYYRVVVTGSAPCGLVNSNATTLKFTNIWTGVTNTDWNTASNWSDGLVPSTICPNVYIPNTTNKPILNNAPAAVITNLIIDPLAKLTVASSATIKIGGSITNSGTFDVSDGSLDFNGAAPQTIAANLFLGNNLKNLMVSNTSLSVSAGGGLLNITGDLAFGNISNATLTTNDNIVLASTATSTARVADITNGGARSGNTFSGKVTVQRYFPALRAWRLITSPLSNTGNIFSTWQNGGVYPPIGIGTLVTGTVTGTGGGGNGLDNGPFLNPSLKTGSSLTDVNNTVTMMLSNSTVSAANIGYLMFIRGDRNPINTTVPNTNITTLSSKGNLQTGTQTFLATGTFGAYTLIGNPYASPVDLDLVTRNNLENLYYVWDPKLSSVGGYVLITGTGPSPSTYTFTPNGSPGAPTQYIQSSEAFFVRTSTTNPASIVFNESNKSSSNNLSMFRPMNPAPSQSLRTNLYMVKSDGNRHMADGNLVQFDDSYNPGVDLQDALKFVNVNETFGVLGGTTSLALERRPPLANTDTVFFSFAKARQLKYQFEFTTELLERDNLAGFVEDKFLNKLSPLIMNGTTKLDFEVTAATASAAIDRFRVVFKPSVVYTKLTAAVFSSDIGVEWIVASELDIKAYDVERSTDGINFTKMGTVTSAGNSNTAVTYTWLDKSPALGHYYYRIRSVSNSNVVGHSNIAKVKINKSTPAIYVFPNPVTENILQLQMNGMPQGVYGVRLMNSLGQAVVTNRISHTAGTATETIRPARKLIAGVYELQVTAPDKKITMVKVIVN